MNIKFIKGTLTLICLLSSLAAISSANDNGIYTRIVDVGAGLCTITRIQDKHYFLYDAGHWKGSKCLDAVSKVIGDNETIDLMVFSHSDSDHIGNAAQILGAFNVNTIIRTGHKNTSKTWQKMNSAVAEESLSGATVRNLKTDSSLKPGDKFQLGVFCPSPRKGMIRNNCSVLQT